MTRAEATGSGDPVETDVSTKIVVLIYSLGPGGAERAVVRWTNHWAQMGWTVVVATLVDGDQVPFYDLDERIRIDSLGVAGHSKNTTEAIINNVRRLGQIRALTSRERPDLLVSVMDRTNVLALLATAGLDTPVIVNEQVYPGRHDIGIVWDFLRRLSYPRAERLVAVSQGTLEWFPEDIQDRGVVITNPVQAPEDLSSTADRRKTVLGMGRLVHQKGFDLLVRAFARASEKHSCWRLVIHGEGEQRSELARLVAELGVDDRVELPGVTEKPFDEMRRAGIFVLSSRYEGFPNVLLEAMASGTPVVSFRCPTGPEEIIRDGVDGVLVPAGDVKQLSDAMGRLMADPGLREKFGECARDVRRRFAPERELARWDALIEEVAAAAER